MKVWSVALPAAVLALGLQLGTASAGVNAGGWMLLHVNESLTYTTEIEDYSGMSGKECDDGPACSHPDATCNGKKNSLDVTVSVPNETTFIFYVLAAWPEERGNSTDCPRIKAVNFGIDYDPDALAIIDKGTPAEFELAYPGWPEPKKGTALNWNSTQYARVMEVYWFAAAAYAPGTVTVVEYPQQGIKFGDDSTPTTLDEAEATGSLGFGGTPGSDGGFTPTAPATWGSLKRRLGK